MSRTPTRRCCTCLKLSRIGSRSSAPRVSSAERLLQPCQVGQLLHEQAVHQLVDHAGVAGEDAGQVRARRTQLHVQLERRPVEAEQLPQRRLAAERIAHAAQVHQRRIGIGRPAIAASRRGAIDARNSRQRRVERNESSRAPATSGSRTPPARRGTDSARARAGSFPATDPDRSPGRFPARSRRPRERRRAAGGRGSCD